MMREGLQQLLMVPEIFPPHFAHFPAKLLAHVTHFMAHFLAQSTQLVSELSTVLNQQVDLAFHFSLAIQHSAH